MVDCVKSGYLGINSPGIDGNIFEFDSCLCRECELKFQEGIAVFVILLDGSVKNDYCLYLCRHISYIIGVAQKYGGVNSSLYFENLRKGGFI